MPSLKVVYITKFAQQCCFVVEITVYTHSRLQSVHNAGSSRCKASTKYR